MSEPDQPEEQNPLTVIPQAAILLHFAHLMVMRIEEPEKYDKVKMAVKHLRTHSVARNAPRSMALIDAVFTDIDKGTSNGKPE